MKRIFIFLLMLQQAQAVTLPFTDHFTYSDGNLFTVGTGVWDAGGSVGAEFVVTNTAALTSPTGFAPASGKGVRWAPSGTARRNLAQFTSANSGDIYVSFLLNIVTAPSGSRLIAYLENGTSSLSNPQLGVFLNGTTLGVGKKASTPAVTTSLSAGTHLIVVRYRFLAGDDQADLWVDPSSSDFGAATAPASLGSTTGASDPTAIQYLALNTTSGSGPVLNIDEVRVATNWAGVTPSDGSTPPTPSSPEVKQAFLILGGFVLRGSGGSPTGTYEVLSTINLSNWTSLASHQFDLSGNFDCTNPVSPLDAQLFYRIHVGASNVAPSITVQPQSQVVVGGETANFSVTAVGTTPLFYKWYFNTNSPMVNATNSTLTISNVSSNDAGVYSVIVSNIAGTAASSFATLTVNPLPTNLPNVELVGFATVNGATTGGGNGPTSVVSSASAFISAVAQAGPRVVLVTGTLNLGTAFADVASDKTIIGLGTNTTLIGNLRMLSVSNIIVQNLRFTNQIGAGDGDGITMNYSHHIWVDHCSFFDCDDGECDITHACDWITVSWCKWFYTANFGHNFVNLIGHADGNGDEDRGTLHVTMHHNWWGAFCNARMPRVRYGKVHVFNNYYNASGNDYCIRAAIESELLVENNYFQSVNDTLDKEGGLIKTSGNVLVDVEDPPDPGTDTVFTPTYSYTLEAAVDVVSNTTQNAGAGKGPFAP